MSLLIDERNPNPHTPYSSLEWLHLAELELLCASISVQSQLPALEQPQQLMMLLRSRIISLFPDPSTRFKVCGPSAISELICQKGRTLPLLDSNEAGWFYLDGLHSREELQTRFPVIGNQEEQWYLEFITGDHHYLLPCSHFRHNDFPVRLEPSK